MVIVRLSGGMGNQLFQYATGRRLAHKLNTELKLDSTYLKNNTRFPYVLDQFNITGTIATPEEIKPLKKICMDTGLGNQRRASAQQVLDYPDNIYLDGDWCDERYFPDIRDILLKEITLKNPLSPNAEAWEHKILSAECAVSMHFRHGDFLYGPNYSNSDKPWFHIPPLDYYYNSIKTLKQAYKNITVFVFSNNIQWVKENLRLDVPTEFVDMRQENETFDSFFKSDIEEMYLMSICKHNIHPKSSFSWWGAYLNQNPDKKVFHSVSSTAQDTLKYTYSLNTNKNSPLDSGKWIYVPFDHNKQPNVAMRPIFSLLLVVNNNAATIAETLDSIFRQDYKYYEIVIIDNASTDDSGKICRKAIVGKENIIFKKLYSKVKNSEAWNMAFNMSIGGGYYVSFLKGNDRFTPNTLASLYLINEWNMKEIIHMFSWLAENENGNINYYNKKCSEQRDLSFIAMKNPLTSNDGQEVTKLLLNRQINNFLATKFYNRNFLLKNEIKFDERLEDTKAELYFQMECFFKSNNFIYVPNTLYVAPKDYLRHSTARIDIQLVPKTTGGNFQILSLSDDKAAVWKPTWFQKDGIGYQIQSYAGRLEFIAKATVDGEIRLDLRGLDIRDPKNNSKRIPYWIDYTRFTVDGKMIFDKLTSVWHDKAYLYRMTVKGNVEVKIQVEWFPPINMN